jgi:hypothetical protein
MMAKEISTGRETASGTALRTGSHRQVRAGEEIRKGPRNTANRKGRMGSRTRRGRAVGDLRTREEGAEEDGRGGVTIRVLGGSERSQSHNITLKSSKGQRS